MVDGVGCRVKSVECGVWSVGCRVSSVGCRVYRLFDVVEAAEGHAVDIEQVRLDLVEPLPGEQVRQPEAARLFA